jgi:hypothetical protein
MLGHTLFKKKETQVAVGLRTSQLELPEISA